MSSRLLRVFLALALATFAWAQEEVVVEAPAGVIVGVVTERGNAFRGIPYAEAPVGKLRFKDPVRARAPQRINATEEGPGCYQDCGLPHWACPPTVSEDCLSLNVFTPHNATTSKNQVPVMVFFHGGNYKMGYGGGPLYNGTYIADQTKVIVVTVNYRLGAFGFLSIPAAGVGSNLAIKDQRMTLEWVRDNIASFGGDPAAVTIFGQSAGGGSVISHLLGPKSKGLFSKAISMSNPWGIKFRDALSMRALAKSVSGALGCGMTSADAGCWIDKSADEILAAQTKAETDFSATGGSMLQLFLPWTPMAGTDDIPYTPNTGFARSQITDVPTVVGTVSEEALLFIHEGFPKPMNALEYIMVVGLIFPDPAKIDAVLKRMPPDSKGPDNRLNLIEMGSQYIFTCPQRRALRAAQSAPARKSPFYSYIFDHAISFGEQCWEKSQYCVGHSCHGGELPIVWNSGDWLFPYTQEEKDLATAMVQFYGNFAHTGNPNHAASASGAADSDRIDGVSKQALLKLAGLAKLRRAGYSAAAASAAAAGNEPEWQEWTNGAEATMWLAGNKHGGRRTVERYLEEPCDFWDTIGYVE